MWSPPERQRIGRDTIEGDAYAFGVTLLETLHFGSWDPTKPATSSYQQDTSSPEDSKSRNSKDVHRAPSGRSSSIAAEDSNSALPPLPKGIHPMMGSLVIDPTSPPIGPDDCL